MTQQEDPLRMHTPVQEVGKEIDDQQLESVQGAARPIDLNTGRPVTPVIIHPTGFLQVPDPSYLPVARPIDLNGHTVEPIVIRPHPATGNPAIGIPRVRPPR
jgi:hypothetical protein